MKSVDRKIMTLVGYKVRDIVIDCLSARVVGCFAWLHEIRTGVRNMITDQVRDEIG